MGDGFSAAEERAGREIVSQISIKGGFPVRDDAWKAFAAQYRQENGGRPIANNPYNLTDPGSSFTWKGFGQIGWREGGSSSEWHSNFASFDTETGGVDAAAANYLGSYYGDVIASLKRRDDPTAVARAIEASPWSTDHYGNMALETIIAQADGGTVIAPMNSPLAMRSDPPIADPFFGTDRFPSVNLNPLPGVSAAIGSAESAIASKLVWVLVLGLLAVLVFAVVTDS